MLNFFERCYFLLELMLPLHVVQEIEQLPPTFFNAMIEQETAKSTSICMTEFNQNNWTEVWHNKNSNGKAWTYQRKGKSYVLVSKTNEPDECRDGLFFGLETGKRKWALCFRKKRMRYYQRDKYDHWHKLPYLPWRESLLKELRAE